VFKRPLFYILPRFVFDRYEWIARRNLPFDEDFEALGLVGGPKSTRRSDYFDFWNRVCSEPSDRMTVS
jgi:hypothetical protein